MNIVNDASAIEALSALAQPTRLSAFRHLVRAEPDGLAVGELARRLDVPQNTLSSHLAILQRAGLVQSERQERLVIYRPRLDAVQTLTMFIIEDCCNGQPELCAPLAKSIKGCRVKAR